MTGVVPRTEQAFDTETLESIEPPWEEIKEWIGEDAPPKSPPPDVTNW